MQYVGISQNTCIEVNTISQYVENGRIDTKKNDLFFYTSTDMKNYMNGREAIKGQAFLSYSSGGYYFFHLEISIGLANAEDVYGIIPNKSKLLITFLSGNSVTLRSAAQSNGTLDKATVRCSYNLLYPIGGLQLRSLVKEELDTIRVQWSTGVETYPIYYVDFFSDHLNCIKTELNDK